PKTVNGIIGNNDAVTKLIEFAGKIHSKQKPRPTILFGPSGTGKTASAHAVAYGNGFELLELNASDYRDVDTLRKRLKPASESRGLFNKNILILLDEIDELSKKLDTGAEKVVRELIKTSKQPIIFTATDFWNKDISYLRMLVDKIEFKKVNNNELKNYLLDILKKENATMKDEVVEKIVIRSNGDVRGAINDLEIMIGANEELIENIGIRDKKIEIFWILDKIFLSNNFDISRNAVTKSDLDIGMLINWVDENITKRYQSKRDVDEAYSNLALASKYYERASRTNHYEYFKYASVLSSSGITISNKGRTSMLKQYTFPSNIRYMSTTKEERSNLKSIADRLSPLLHTNRKKIISNYIPILKIAIEDSIKKYGKEQTLSNIAFTMGLFQEDIEIILGKKIK
ncbi:MAG: replication factor C large subunit, partial [Candidatus Micrarchaeaceae archaeon]